MECRDSQQLLQAARQGDASAVATLFRAINPGLATYVRRRAPEVADDLVAETWAAAAEHLGDLPGDLDGLRAWLFTVARRRIADHYRRLSRTFDALPSLREATAGLDAERGAVEPFPDLADGVVAALSSDEALSRLVRTLSGDQAEVVLLRVVGGLEPAQVAEVMGRKVGWVRVMQHRALERLRHSWVPEVVTP